MLHVYVRIHTALVRPLHRDERGQASAEYALVLLGAAAIALLIVSWATHSNKIGELFDAVLERLQGHAEQ